MEDDRAVEFICSSDCYDEIPKPKPATKELPDWVKGLDFEDEGSSSGMTVRSCMAFMDAMTMGWVIPAPFDIEFHVSDDMDKLRYDAKTDNHALDYHDWSALGGEDNPMLPRPIIQFKTPWITHTPKGTSILVTAPMNRHEPRFTPFSGVIDSDSYYGITNAPARWDKPGYDGVVEKGTPLVQVIPFDRDGVIGDGVIRSATKHDMKAKQATVNQVNAVDYSYMNNVWAGKNQARVIEKEESSYDDD